ncbi:phosphotransferase-like protein [Kribbella sp. NBC_01484]
MYFVGVRCSLPELRRRELARGNRTTAFDQLRSRAPGSKNRLRPGRG